MPDLRVAKAYDGHSHSPPKVKDNEQNIAYNPFWMDLRIERPQLDPDWARQPGIILNWLLKEEDSLILGVEANSVENMRSFMRTFAIGGEQNMSDDQISSLLTLGHPTLACKISSANVVATTNENAQAAFVQENYSGILGGELHYGQKSGWTKEAWYVNYNSGRYGPQHLPDRATKNRYKTRVKQLFGTYCGVRVYD